MWPLSWANNLTCSSLVLVSCFLKPRVKGMLGSWGTWAGPHPFLPLHSLSSTQEFLFPPGRFWKALPCDISCSLWKKIHSKYPLNSGYISDFFYVPDPHYVPTKTVPSLERFWWPAGAPPMKGAFRNNSVCLITKPDFKICEWGKCKGLFVLWMGSPKTTYLKKQKVRSVQYLKNVTPITTCLEFLFCNQLFLIKNM